MKIISFYDLNNYKLIKEKDKNNRDIRLYSFDNVELTGNSHHYPDVLLKTDELILPTKEMTMSLGKRSYYEENGMEFDYKEGMKKKIINEEVFYFIYNTENYYHFIYDTLPYLYCFFQLKEVKLLMNYNKDKNKILPFVKECLELCGIDNSKIIIHEEGNIYKKIYLSSSLTHNGLSNLPPRDEIFDIYNLMIKNVKKVDFNLYDKIYISRRTWINDKKNDNIGTNYTLRRKLMNEDELVEKLEKKGFKEIFGENLTMNEKILIFNSAKVVIGAIGGTITNCIFCNKNALIIPIVSPEFLKINYRMKYLFKENVELFQDTKVHLEEGKIPKNVRIETNDNKLGEIDSYSGNGNYLVKIGKNYIGWNENDEYELIEINESKFKTLDNGINSPWTINTNKLLALL